MTPYRGHSGSAGMRLMNVLQHVLPGGPAAPGASPESAATAARAAAPAKAQAAAPVAAAVARAAPAATAVAAPKERSRLALERLEASLAGPAPPVGRQDLVETFRGLQDASAGPGASISEHFPGPLRDPSRTRDDILAEFLRALRSGTPHVLLVKTQQRYCQDGPSSNFVMPMITRRPGQPPVITQQIILAHPSDCERIARTHIKKQLYPYSGAFGSILGSSILSTQDNGHWKRQRESLAAAFHPIASLSKVFPAVVRRAAGSADRLAELARDGPVDISDFFLHEALAQLMLGLFGFPEDFMDATNSRFREVLSGQGGGDPRFFPAFMETLIEMMKDPEHTSPEEAMGHDVHLHGPLSRVVDSAMDDEGVATKIGNVFLFAFAGHDTTGHTMTWLIFELCRHPDIQTKLQLEVDDLFDRLSGRAMEYRDLTSLTYMTRCIVETLRLWPVLGQGTFRELETDDWVHGEAGEKIPVPAGTLVQITTGFRHRNVELWGPDVNIFNPDRHFRGAELWDEQGFAASNPATARFSPFTHQPRDCLGKNFAQSEMRAILCHVLHRFSFRLAQPEHAARQQGVDYGTLGPRDFSRQAPSSPTFRDRVPIGLLVQATGRHPAPAATSVHA